MLTPKSKLKATEMNAGQLVWGNLTYEIYALLTAI